MRTRDVLGRTIVKVNQSRYYDTLIGQMVVVTDSIELDNGKIISLYAADDGIEPYVTTRVVSA